MQSFNLGTDRFISFQLAPILDPQCITKEDSEKQCLRNIETQWHNMTCQEILKRNTDNTSTGRADSCATAVLRLSIMSFKADKT